MFDPSQPFTRQASHSFEDHPHLHVLCQGSQTYFVKSFSAAKITNAKEQIERELEAIESFRRLGVDVLEPIAGPFDELTIKIAEQDVHLECVLVYPFLELKTLNHLIRTSEPDAFDVLEEAGARIYARHRASSDLTSIHSDGAPHNIFQNWMWFDLGNSHRSNDLSVAKAHEIWRFIAGALAVNPNPDADARVIHAFAQGYRDHEILALAVTEFGRRWPTLRMLLQLKKYWRWRQGHAEELIRLRASKVILQELK